MKLNLALLATSIVIASALVRSAQAQAPEYGPARGTLVIQGGGTDEETGIFETFINRAGGLGAHRARSRRGDHRAARGGPAGAAHRLLRELVHLRAGGRAGRK